MKNKCLFEYNNNLFKLKLSQIKPDVPVEKHKSYLTAFSHLLSYQKLAVAFRRQYLNKILSIRHHPSFFENNDNIIKLVDHNHKNHLILRLPLKYASSISKNDDLKKDAILYQKIEMATIALSMITFGPERKIEKINQKNNKIVLINKPLKNGGVEFSTKLKQYYLVAIEKSFDSMFKIIGCALITDHKVTKKSDRGVQISRVVSTQPRKGIAYSLQIATILLNPDRLIFLNARYAKQDHHHAPMDRRKIYSKYFTESGLPFLYNGLKNIRMDSHPNDSSRKKLWKINSHLNNKNIKVTLHTFRKKSNTSREG